MPAMYAHDRFGQDVITKLSGTLEELVTVERVAFDLGLQGPDLLYYYQPLLPNSIQKIGGRVHNMSGGRFLTRCAKVQRRESNDQGLAYLMGSVCHYALDVACHPIVEHRCKAGDFVHTEIEMAFDRALMVRDGLDPLTVAIGGNLETDGSFETEEVIASRLATAGVEAEKINQYDYVVINDEVENCVEAIHRLIDAEHQRTQFNGAKIQELQKDLQAYRKGE